MIGIKRHIGLFILIGVFHYSSSPQISFPLELKKADSLQQFLPSSQGREKVDVLNTMSYALIRHYSNRSDSLASLSLELAEKLDYKEGKAMALYCKAANTFIFGDFIEVLNMSYEAVDLFKETGDTAMIIDTYFLVAETYYFSGTDIPEAIRLINRGLQYSIASNDNRRTAQMYSALQYVWGLSGQADKSRYYIDKYKSVTEKFTAHKLESIMIEAAIGRCYAIKGDYRKAINQCLKACSILHPNSIEERAFLSQQYSSNGNIYLKLGKPDSAFYYYTHGLELARKNQHYYGSIENTMGLARYYHLVKDDKNAEVYCDSVLYFGKKIDSSGSFYGIREYLKLLGISGEIYMPTTNAFKRYYAWKMMVQAYSLLVEIHQSHNMYKKAFEVNKSYAKIQDSIVGYQKRKEILDLQYKYQTGQKDNQIQLLSQENQLQSLKISQNRFILLAVGVIIFLVVLILLLILRQIRIRSQEQVTEIKQKLFRSQMNPHFIFNSLTSVQNFIISHDEIKASVYLSRFSDLVRSILNNSMVEQITLEEEIATIENYLELQKIRFTDKFDYSIEVDETVNTENILIPPMLAQPFIENSIEHGFKNKKTKGSIMIRFKMDKNRILYEVEDDGIGRQKARKILNKLDKDHNSLATTITIERIKVLNKKLNNKISMNIEDLKDNEGNAIGTKVVFAVRV
jgi:tetratricopeptide (TPR) repeat protein